MKDIKQIQEENRMTNKLPKIGERYKYTNLSDEIMIVESDNPPVYYRHIKDDTRVYRISNSMFFDHFEPLPSPKEQEEDRCELIAEDVRNTKGDMITGDGDCPNEQGEPHLNLTDDMLNQINEQYQEDEEVSISKKETTIEFDVAKVCVAKEELRAEIGEFKKLPTQELFMKAMQSEEGRAVINIYSTIHRAAQNLVNALESIKEDKTDMKEELKCKTIGHLQESLNGGPFSDCLECGATKEECDIDHVNLKMGKEPVKKTEESLPDIWKDVRELPKALDGNACFYKKDGGIFIGEAHTFGDGVIYPDQQSPCVKDVEGVCLVSDFITQQEQNTKRLDKLELLIKGE